MRTWAIVLAAGEADRFGAAKQFALLGGRRCVDRVVATASEACDACVVVLPPGYLWDGQEVAAAVPGGATRAESVREGLGAVDLSAEIVVVCDAAHPLAPVALFRSVLDAVEGGAVAAVPTVPLTEALKRVDSGRLVATVQRNGLALAQTPQAFRAAALRAVHASGPEVPEDSELVAGAVVVPGDPGNLHVATRLDLALAERLISGARYGW